MTTAISALKRRKSPVQARSSITVGALRQAAIHVLINEGIGRCTTTRICERAGTSVGSLYQYYPNRDALIADVLEIHLTGIAEKVQRACEEQHGQSPDSMASAFVEAFVAAKLSDSEAAIALYAVAEKCGGAALAASMRERTVSAVGSMLRSAPGPKLAEPDLVAAVALGALVGPVHAVLASDTPQDPVQLAEELSVLVKAYFRERLAAPLGPQR